MICLALLIFCLVERQVRQALAPHAEMMTGLPGYGPAHARPTGRTIFRALADLRLIPAHDGNPATIPKPVGVQARLLDLLNIDISRPRWLQRLRPRRRSGAALCDKGRKAILGGGTPPQLPAPGQHDKCDDRAGRDGEPGPMATFHLASPSTDRTPSHPRAGDTGMWRGSFAA